MRKFSILLPTFNSMQYLQVCLQSILSQTYSHFALHIVDGGSTDETIAYIETLNDPRILIYRSDKRLSIEENWSRFVSIAKNEFMTIIGHDDLYATNFLEEINELVDKFPSASLYQTHFSYVDKDGDVVRNCAAMPDKIMPVEFLKGILTGGVDIMATGFVMRSADYDRFGGIPIFPKLLFADDALWLKLTALSYLAVSKKNCFSFRYHQNTSNVLLGETTFRSLNEYVNFLEDTKKEVPALQPVIEKYGAGYITARCREMVIRMIRKPLKERNNLLVSEVIKGCKTYASTLSPGGKIDLLNDKKILSANIIDSNFFTRGVFVLFKKYYKKPIAK